MMGDGATGSRGVVDSKGDGRKIDRGPIAAAKLCYVVGSGRMTLARIGLVDEGSLTRASLNRLEYYTQIT